MTTPNKTANDLADFSSSTLLELLANEIALENGKHDDVHAIAIDGASRYRDEGLSAAGAMFSMIDRVMEPASSRYSINDIIAELQSRDTALDLAGDRDPAHDQAQHKQPPAGREVELNAKLADQLEQVDSLTEWHCEQVAAQVDGALALLPGGDQLWRGLALSDRVGNSPEQAARMRLARTIETTRKLLEGIRSHTSDLHNEIDCVVADLCETVGTLTPKRAAWAKEMAAGRAPAEQQ